MTVATHRHNPPVVYWSFTILQDLSMSCYFLYLVALDIIMQVKKIAGSRGRAPVAPRTARNPQSSIAPSADGAIPGLRPWPPPPPCGGWTTGAICQPTNTNALPAMDVERHLCVPPPAEGNDFAPICQTTKPSTDKRPPSTTRIGVGTAALRLCRELRHLRMAL